MGDEMVFDAVVVGTGFGGAVTACRLAEAGETVCILERGRRYGREDFPRLQLETKDLPNLARWRWSSDHGLWDVRDLGGMVVAQAAGYGGGSLIYANTHLRAPADIFEHGWPDGVRREALEEYYNLVAYMLDVRAVPPKAFDPPAPKSRLFGEMAGALGRQDRTFDAPVAIHFGEPRINAFRREQLGCNACGDCDIGCSTHSKNTLDLNYLASAEEAAGTQVRTLAEVTRVEHLADGSDGSDSPRWRVHYSDHLFSGKHRSVDARQVFLCAGAVGSTEILLRSQAEGFLGHQGKLPVGEGYFANADAIAMVYDTAEKMRPSYGPTITKCLLYDREEKDREKSDRRDWFLIEEGGYPASMNLLFGLPRGGLWLGRNRYPGPGNGGGRKEPPTAEQRQQAERVAAMIHHVADYVTGSWSDPTRGLEAIVPAQLRAILTELTDKAKALEGEVLKAATDQTIAHLVDLFVAAKVRQIVQFFTRSGEVKHDRWLERGATWLLKRLAQVARTQVDAFTVPAARRMIYERYLFARKEEGDRLFPEAARRLVTDLAIHLGVGEVPGEDTAMLLVMGRDRDPGRLWLEGEDLRADWCLQHNQPLYTAQERLLRDCATALGGELRLNPNYAYRQQPVTVHSLGGCAMSSDATRGVTDEWGAVRGCPGLYVMDGALVPVSLGVNPASTIAALAERNIEHCLREHGHPGFRARQWDEAQRSAASRLPELDPLGHLAVTPGGAEAPRAAPIGLEFDERMDGFFDVVPAGSNPQRIGGFFAETATPRPSRARMLAQSHFSDLAAKGQRGGNRIALVLHAVLTDLNAFLADKQHPIAIEGAATLRRPGATRDTSYRAAGTLELMPQLPQQEQDARRLRYDMRLTDADTKSVLALEGVKVVENDAGFDSWSDTTTVFFELKDQGTLIGAGTMRVHIADFVGKQLPSFKVTGTDDSVQILWALTRFGAFFGRNLQRVYLPQLGRLFDLETRRSHP